MEILQGLDGLRRVPGGAVVSIGNFDGVHRGHQRILQRARALRQEHATGALAAVTFEPHPLTVLRPEIAPPRLTPPTLKEELLAREGVDFLVVLPPDRSVLNLTAEDFWRILRDKVRPACLVEGDSFTFGKGRAGTIDRLREWAAASPVRLEVIDAVQVALLDLSVVSVSSSLIRWLLLHGRARDAAICLGRAYALVGEVVKGHQRGRALGVPTANLRCDDQLVPADGVYAARCEVNGTVYRVALSVGTMPTFGEHKRQVEAHLVGFSGDLYGARLRVEVVDWIREQWKFQQVDTLLQQIRRDIDLAVERGGIDPAIGVCEAR